MDSKYSVLNGIVAMISGQFLISLLGAKCDPRGELCPPGE
jgi:hypothetical protein